jgi:hypothetical protein
VTLRNVDGVWEYDEPEQSELVFTVWNLTGWEMAGFDSWISTSRHWEYHPQKLAHLLALRERLTQAYRQHRDNNELLSLHAELLLAEAHRVVSVIKGEPLEVAANKQSQKQSLRRQGKGKLTLSQKRGIVRRWDAAFSTYGLLKSFAREFEVSEDTISRIVKSSVPD